MDKQAEMKRLFNAGFKESAEWTDWYFNHVFNPDNALIGYANGQPVSGLMLDRYDLRLGNQSVGMGYISCATTLRSARGQGHMRRLVNDALMEAASRGDALVSLIPASERLYFYYDRFDFATIFYADELRYTSCHQFHINPGLIETNPSYDGFHTLETERRARVMHSRSNFENILTDNALDNGEVIFLADKGDGDIRAALFAVNGNEAVKVKDIMARDEAAMESALGVLRGRVGERMMIIDAAPGDNPAMLSSHGMGRIVNVRQILQTLATEVPKTEQVIRVHDRIISDNDAIFIIHNGTVERTATTMRRVTLDVNVDTLAEIIFNSQRVGDVFGLPSFRPAMSLMLE